VGGGLRRRRKAHHSDTLRIALQALPRGLNAGVSVWQWSLTFRNADERSARSASPQKSNYAAAIGTHEAIIGLPGL